jgi:hypothetical protein
MRETEASRVDPATPDELERALDPASVVEYEGSFQVLDVESDGAATLVTAGGSGLRMTLRFESREDGLRYVQEGDAGPFDEMWTELSWEPEDEGSQLSARSGVSLGLPLAAVTDRVAAWKRRGELRRALGRVAADVP